MSGLSLEVMLFIERVRAQTPPARNECSHCGAPRGHGDACGYCRVPYLDEARPRATARTDRDRLDDAIDLWNET